MSADGIQGQFKAEPPMQGREGTSKVRVQFANGRQVWVSAEELIPQAEGHYLLPLQLATLTETAGQGSETHIIPVVAETLSVTKRQVETGGVRITKRVQEHEEVIDEPLLREEVEVQRVTVNRFVEKPMPVRIENDTVIIPLFEEVLVVEKRLLLKEELHICRHQSAVRHPQTVVRRSEEVSVERFQSSGSQEGSETSE